MNPVAWFRRGERFDWPRILLVVLLIAVLATVGVGSLVTTAAFSPYGATWEGTGEFRTHMADAEDRSVEILTATSEYDELTATETAAFVFAPESTYTGEEIAHIQAFLDRGGTLVVLDSTAENANTLLAGLGAEARLDGQILQDEHHYADGPLLPIATEISNHSLVAGIEQVTLNHATAIEAGAATIVVSTSPFAYFNVYGPRQRAGNYAGAVATFINQALDDEPITGHGDGAQTRDFVYVSDVVRANRLAAETDHIGEADNVATGEATSIRALAETIQDLTDTDADIVHVEGREGDIEHSVADISKVRDELGFEPEVGLEDGLKQTIEWYRDRTD